MRLKEALSLPQVRGTGRWVWVTGPEYAFEEDGSERAMLEPVDLVEDWHYSDEAPTWTCHRDTKVNDLSVIYRSRGPKDFRYLALVTSPPFRSPEDDEFQDEWICRFVILSKLEPPLALGAARLDSVLETWPALRANFVQASMPAPEPYWSRLFRGARSAPTPRAVPPAEILQRERALEEWLGAHLDHLPGWDLELVATQLHLEGHDGIVDVLCRRRQRKRELVVIEIKAGEARRDAAAQTLGYMQWVRQNYETTSVEGLIIGTTEHRQLPYVRDEVAPKLSWLSWAEVELPDELETLLIWPTP